MNMSDAAQELDIIVKATVDNDIEVDDDGKCFIVSLVYLDEPDEPQEIRVSFDSVVDSLQEFYKNLDGYQKLYSIAHELSRQAERLRDTASCFEDSMDVVCDMFEVDV